MSALCRGTRDKHCRGRLCRYRKREIEILSGDPSPQMGLCIWILCAGALEARIVGRGSVDTERDIEIVGDPSPQMGLCAWMLCAGALDTSIVGRGSAETERDNYR